MKIYLIGMPGSGKTTLGKELADQLMLDFIDLDREIESHEQRSIPEIFRERGEDHFRQTESRLLYEWAASGKSFVMATGGGAPCHFGGMEVINRSGISIFLDVDPDELAQRLKHSVNRPLLNDSGNDVKGKLEKLLEARKGFYMQAHFTATSPSAKSLLKLIRFRT